MLTVALERFNKHYEDLDADEWRYMPEYAAVWLLERQERLF